MTYLIDPHTFGVPAWSPAGVGSLIGWYKGDTLTGSDGDPITTATDYSGLGNDGTAPSSPERPTLEAAGLNGLNIYRFDGSVSGKTFTLPDMLSGLSACSIFYVAKCVAQPGNAALGEGSPFAFGTHVSGGDGNYYTYSGDSKIYDDFCSTARKTVGNTPTTTADWHIGNFHSAANDWAFYFNGITPALFSTATNTYGGRNPPVWGWGLASTWNGRMPELLIYSAVLSSTNREKIEGYLAHKWGVASVLDAGHPYKAAPP